MKHRDTMVNVCQTCVDAAYHETRATAFREIADIIGNYAARCFLADEDYAAERLRFVMVDIHQRANEEAHDSELFEKSTAHTCVKATP